MLHVQQRLVGPITAYGGQTYVTSQTGTGSTFVMQTSGSLTTPTINTAASVGGAWTAAATWTLPAFTLGGTVTLNGQTLSGAAAFDNSITTTAAVATIVANRNGTGAGKYALVRWSTSGTTKWQAGIDGDLSDTAWRLYDFNASKDAIVVAPAGKILLNAAGTMWANAPTNVGFYCNYDAVANASLDAASSSWAYILGAGADIFAVYRAAATAGVPSFTQHFNINSVGVPNVCSSTATPAGGSTSARLVFGTTAGFGIYYGSGAPTVSAAKGSLYLRSDGSSTSTRMYVNTDGSTTWTNVTTAA